MIPKQDRQGVRHARDIEQKYDLNTDFSQIEKMAANAQSTARNAVSVASGAASVAAQAQSTAEALGAAVSQNTESIEDVVARLDELESASLPTSYTELEYIESSGTQYIDTGFTPSEVSKFKFTMDVAFLSYTNALYGDGNTFAGYFTGEIASFALFGGELGQNANAPFDTNRHVFELDGTSGTGSIDGAVTRFASGSKALKHPFYLFGWNADKYNSSRLYSAQLYYDGAMVRNYVPCINPSGEAGLYDLVSATFFGNSGTGSFVYECVNPPMEVGVEYRTTERFMGKPVYVKLVSGRNLGAANSTIEFVAISGGDIRMIEAVSYMKNDSANFLFLLPYNDNLVGGRKVTSDWVYLASSQEYSFRFTTNADFTSYTGLVKVKYIKTTD